MLSLVVSSVMPFPNIQWWCYVINVDKIVWDLGEHYEKMSARNRYEIATANGKLKLSIPLKNGRDQRTKMCELEISNVENWQQQHWRTLYSAYNRSPYFEHYASLLKPFFSNRFDSIRDFNITSINWVMKQIGLMMEMEFIFSYVKGDTENVPDLRLLSNKSLLSEPTEFPIYNQVFKERNGFLPNLSILDLLFSEGPYTLQFLKKHKQQIMSL